MPFYRHTDANQLTSWVKSLWYRGTLLVTLGFAPRLLAEQQYDYDSSTPQTIWQGLYTFVDKLLLPNLAGAFLLLVLSALFSSINFYKDVPALQIRTGHRAGRYLAAWILANYIFALIFLLLILPDTVSLSSVDKTLFVYCLIATALPEVATNIKLSLGKADKSLDLYKYKEQVTDLIADRVKNSRDEYRSQQLINLSYFYYDRLPDFLEKLAIFETQARLSDEETESLEQLRTKLVEEPADGRVHRVLQLHQEHMILVPRLLNFFESDIRKFNDSPVADLMKKLSPNLKIHEARNLVASGVTASTWLLLRCHLPAYRKRLAERTGIERHEIELMYHTSRFLMRKRFNRSTASAISILVGIAIAAGLFSWHERRIISLTELPEQEGEEISQYPMDYANKELFILESSTQPIARSTPSEDQGE